ncbi:hypothetical protein EY04_17105 [Pseudomonas chlororaphis]|uniref:hypothetical protein n=1 Tax=Pseudomonas chlororaphis TaxID=587753 RepID=UPI0004AC0676|nr:hypothetical protein [Pseudomonas chlororaphis]AIC20561.1 hypothetical protein EY04_17105 [Pseudomonas chlororaphis]
MAWLRAGTVAVTNGSTTVTGTGTGFAANTRVGDAFIGPDGRQYELGNVASDTVISITPAYQGATASGASYAIMPVQGYQKLLADQVRDWVNTYGTKMAALGTTGNYDILPLEKGGTGNTTGTAQKLAAAAILGTVSQSGGLPTGAIFESGSSSAGSWVKFASGFMITMQNVSVTPGWSAVAANRYAGPIIGNMPALFIGTPFLFVQVRDTSVAGRAAWCPLAEATNGNTFSLFLASPAASTITSVLSFNIFSVGRWF